MRTSTFMRQAADEEEEEHADGLHDRSAMITGGEVDRSAAARRPRTGRTALRTGRRRCRRPWWSPAPQAARHTFRVNETSTNTQKKQVWMNWMY